MAYNDPSRNQSKWDVARFLSTLNYFGEVPFLGSFRWIQQWLGQTSVVSGVALNAMTNKVGIIGADGSDCLCELKAQLLPLVISSVDVQFYEWPKERPEPKLEDCIRAVDTLVVLNVTDCLNLVPNLEVFFEDISGFVETSVFDFASAGDDLSAWGALDDVVMGGVSQGNFVRQSQQAVFAGVVSTNNSGGFSSVRTRNFDPPFDFSNWRGLRLRVKGDGQRYKFILRNSDGWDSPAYIYGFDTRENVWMDIDVPFDQLVPTFRARSVPNAPAFDTAKVFSFQLMLSKFEVDRQLNPQFAPGPFELAVEKISAYRDRQGVPLILVGELDDPLHVRLRSRLEASKVAYRWVELDEPNGVSTMAFAKRLNEKLSERIAQILTEPQLEQPQ